MGPHHARASDATLATVRAYDRPWAEQVPLRNTPPRQIEMSDMLYLVAPPARSCRLDGWLTHCMMLSMADDTCLI